MRPSPIATRPGPAGAPPDEDRGAGTAPRPLRILLVAAEAAGSQVLRAVAAGGCSVAGVLAGDGRATESAVGSGIGATAHRLGCPVWPARSVRDPAFADHLRHDGVDILLNVHSLFVICPEVLAAPRIGSFNLHPGPLPECAGLNAVSWALYEGKPQHAVTLHWMAPAIDAGPVAYQATFDIEERDTALTLSIKAVKAGLPLIEGLLATAAANPAAIPSEPQDLTRRCYHGREIPQDGLLIWSRPARDVVNFVRACDYLPYASPWGHPRTVFGQREVAVVKAARTGIPADAVPGALGDVTGRGVMVSAADEWVLVHRLLCDGRMMDARELLAPGGRLAGAGGRPA